MGTFLAYVFDPAILQKNNRMGKDYVSAIIFQLLTMCCFISAREFFHLLQKTNSGENWWNEV